MLYLCINKMRQQLNLYTIMTHRLYINEYNKELVYQLSHNSISGLYCTDESTNNVLVISGELEDLQKLSSLMYEEDEMKIKKVLPGFITKEETFEDIDKAFKKIHDVMQSEILKVVNKNWDKTSYHLARVDKWKVIAEMYDKILETER